MPRLHLLGTGSGLQNPARGASSYLLEGPHGDLLLDAGEPVSATLARRQYDWSRLSGIVISHTHADHLGGLPMLMQQIHISGRTHDLVLHAPAEFANLAASHLSTFYLLPEAFAFKLHIRSLVATQEFELAAFRLLPSSTTHLEPYRPRVQEGAHAQRCEAFAFSVQAGAARIFYSGDVGHFDDIRDALQGARFAVVDSTHIDPEAVAAWAQAHPETTVILSHVSPKWPLGVDAELRRRFPGASLRLAVEGEALEF